MAIDPRLVVARSFTDEQRRAYAFAVGRGRSRSAAAREVGVGYDTVKRALAADPVFADAVETAEGEKWDLAEDKLYEALQDGEPWAVKLVVKEAAGLRERWKPADTGVTVTAEIGSGLAGVLELQAVLEARAGALSAGSAALGGGVIDVESSEAP